MSTVGLIFPVMGLGAIIYVFALLGFGMSLNWTHLIFCIVVMTIAEMISIPATTAATGSLAPQDRVGRYMGLYGLVQGIGWSMGPFLGSQLFELYAGRPVMLWATLSCPALMAGMGCQWLAQRLILLGPTPIFLASDNCLTPFDIINTFSFIFYPF